MRTRTIQSLYIISFAAAASAPAAAQQFLEQQSTRFPQPPLNEYTNQMSVCDVDGDGDLDIAFANGGGWPSAGADQQVRLFINNGLGVFTDESIARVGVLLGDFRGVEFGDIERDGDWDMVLANDNAALPRLLRNNGAGVFTDVTAAQLTTATMGSSRAQFADVDNDGDLDLYFTNGVTSRFGTGRGKLYLNNGAGTFTDATTTNTPNETVTEPQDCIFGDIDGDLDLDLRIGSTAPNQSKLYVNNGSGVFAPAPVAPPADTNCYSYDFGDMNGDGDLDLIGANAAAAGNNAELELINNGAGVYSVGPFTGTTNDDNDSKFFDYDNDGDLDLFIARLAGPERAYTNDGAGNMALATNIIQQISDSTLDIKVADFNGDGRYDIITAQGESLQPYTDRIYINSTGPVDNRPPTIVKTEQLPDTASPGPYAVRMTAFDAHTSDRGFHDKGVTLYWRRGGVGAFTAEDMKWSGNSLWRGVIPVQPNSGLMEYYVTARDFANNLATGPTKTFTLTLPCPANITAPNGMVDINDLLEVINNWGACLPPCPPRCAADIDPIIAGDCQVNINDLLAVINAWGPCP